MEAFRHTKFKELEKWKPIWQALSKEVAKIFDSATKAEISETRARELDDKTLEKEVHNLATGVAPEKKDMCFGSMYQEEGVHSVLKARLTNPSELTGLEVWDTREGPIERW